MRRFVGACALALCALAASGCKHDRAKAIAASYSSATRPIAIDTAQIPVEEEYEARSAIAITGANLAEQVSALETELR